MNLYRAAPMRRYRAGSQNELVYLPAHKRAHLVPAADLQLALRCSRFKTLSDHAGSNTDALERLTRLASIGVLISHSEIERQASNEAESTGRIEWIAIPTAGRPEQLDRCLSSYSTATRQTTALLVCDGSRNPETAIRNRALAARHKARYEGAEEKRTFADELAATSGVSAHIVNFALTGEGLSAVPYGANRNAILLRTAGTMVFTADDDTLACPRSLTGAVDERLTIGNESDPSEAWYYVSRAEALRAGRPLDIDITAEHERLLGRSVASLASRAANSGKLEAGPACGHLVTSLLHGSGTVRLTYGGLAGDCATRSAAGLLVHPSRQTRQRLDHHLAAGFNGRHIARHVPGLTITHGSTSLSTFTGLDNREILPPYLPAYAGEDGVFAFLVAHAMPECYSGHLPWALAHNPPSDRAFEGAPDTVFLSDALIACIGAWTGRAGSPADRLQSVGRHLAELACLPVPVFAELYRETMWARASRMLDTFDALLRIEAGGAETVSRHISQHTEILARSMESSEFGLPADVCPQASRQERLQALQRCAGLYGELLQAWPALFETATKLR